MKKRKKARVARFILSLIAVFALGSFAFLAWFFWGDIKELVKRIDRKITSQEKVGPSQEILEEERKQLEEIIKRRK